MMKHGFLLAALLPMAALAGCQGTRNRGLESVHQPVVDHNDYAFDVAVTPNGLAPGEAQRLDGWLSSLRVGYGDRVAIDAASADGGPARAMIRHEVARYGVLLSDGAPVTPTPVTPGTMRVVVSRMRAYVPGCPDHSKIPTIDFESNTDSNFGCAVNSNLAAMVARPEDLVRGRSGDGLTDSAVATKAIQTFREAPNTGKGDLKDQSTTKAVTGG
ncbi:CpaD family pilus assembly protein [Hephaestia mangrovi]|uniref:CpaD family pilus assembly protein n=1 Tax=Hephaestia mangrovi TaxID=2873268 RepID=UPI001CA6ACE3|nr:CpaD family pilus assembly protein [Hephaestia mangrovi]MBY8828203.1 CpaD family pilus assembly protein [Hephaestia mangrovi]